MKRSVSALLAGLLLNAIGGTAFAQVSYPPPNDAPNPYRAAVRFGELPRSEEHPRGPWPVLAVDHDGSIYLSIPGGIKKAVKQ